RRQTQALESRQRLSGFGQEFGNGAAKSAYDAVFFNREDRRRLACRVQDGFRVKRLQGVHAEDTCAEAVCRETVCGLQDKSQHSTGRNQCKVLSLTDTDCLANLEIDLGRVNLGLTGLTQPQVARSGVIYDRTSGVAGFEWIRGRDHGHSWQHAHDAQVLSRVMRGARCTVTEAAPHAYHLDVGVVVTNVVANMLQATKCREVANGIGKYDLATQGHSGGHSRHILLGNTGIHELLGECLHEGLNYAETQIAGNEHDALVLLRQLEQSLDECGPHGRSNSAIACSSSSPRGAR